MSWIIQAAADMSHPNRRAFQGVLARVDEPSDTAPTGARFHRVLLTKKAALDALPSLIGMALNCKLDFNGHNERSKCGVITNAYLEGNKVIVDGYVYIKDFPEFKSITNQYQLGMSYELHN